MVLTVTLNPILEHRFCIDKIKIGNPNRTKSETLTAGGKGINISRELNCLGVDNLALTFAGGNNGKMFRRILAEEKINNVLINTKSETRFSINVLDQDNQKVTSFFSPNPEITTEEIKLMKEKFEKIIPNASIVVFSGSSPSSLTDEFFSYAINYANSLDKVTILDTYGNHMQSCIDAKPMMIHSNVSEAENSLGIDLSTDDKKKEFLLNMYSKGIKFYFLTDGKNNLYSSQYDFLFKVSPPLIDEIDPTGSGDAFLAGIIYGFEKSLIFTDMLKIATALGAANASSLDTCKVSKNILTDYLDKVKISIIGKNLKIIDDSPQR